jgi:hypothetical protein
MHNKASHGDVYYIAASPPFRSRACWLALHAYETDNSYISISILQRRFRWGMLRALFPSA